MKVSAVYFSQIHPIFSYPDLYTFVNSPHILVCNRTLCISYWTCQNNHSTLIPNPTLLAYKLMTYVLWSDSPCMILSRGERLLFTNTTASYCIIWNAIVIVITIIYYPSSTSPSYIITIINHHHHHILSLSSFIIIIIYHNSSIIIIIISISGLRDKSVDIMDKIYVDILNHSMLHCFSSSENSIVIISIHVY